MKWEDTIARTCRYGWIMSEIFEDGDVIWENSESNYQGFANVLVAMPDGSFIHYEWTYGSCSGCDEWEARGLSDEEIINEVKRAMAVFHDVGQLKKYLKLEDEYADATVPSANSVTNGSVPGMIRFLGGGIAEDFKAMGEAFVKWEEHKCDE